jgi:Domain of unknown function (DUF4082)
LSPLSDAEIGGYTVFMDGEPIQELPRYATDFTVDIPPGNHTLQISCFDTDGRESLMATVPVTATKPVAAIKPVVVNAYQKTLKNVGVSYSVWNDSDKPINASENDSGSVELGVKFKSDVDGFIKGIRFYKGTGNTGVHIGNLWTRTGKLLASAAFTGETASGWQQVNFSNPVAISKNTVYVASYFAPKGHYANDNYVFKRSGIDNGFLHLLKNGQSGANGIYAYARRSSFPRSTWLYTNYFVDVVFSVK